MSLLNNLLNKNIKEDLDFEKYNKLDDIFYKYKNYLNFIKKTEKIEIENITNINKETKLEIKISNSLYDLIDNIYLYIEFDNIDKEYSINELIEKIDLYIGEKNIESIDGDILNLYFNIYKNQNNQKIYNILSKIDNNSRIIYIPIIFYFMLEKKNLIPMHLLYYEDILLYIKFNNEKNLTVEKKKIYLIVNYIKLDVKYINTIKYKDDIELLNSIVKNKFNLERIEKIKKDNLECTIDGVSRNNIFNININKFITHIILKIEDVTVESIELKLNTFSLKYTSKELKYLTLLNTDFNLNNEENIYLINFGLFKNKLSGFVNFNLINNLCLEIKTINTDNINLNFSEINGLLKLSRANASDIVSSTIILSKNIVYNIINTNNIDIIVVKEVINNTLYEDYDDINKTFILKDDTPRLYFKDRNNNNIVPISIDIGILNTGDFKYKIGLLKLYVLEYKSYNIYNGKLIGINEKKENYLIIKLNNILETIDNKKLRKKNYNIFRDLKLEYKSLIDNNDIIEDLLKELIKNEKIKEKVIINIKELINKLEKKKELIYKKKVVKIDNEEL